MVPLRVGEAALDGEDVCVSVELELYVAEELDVAEEVADEVALGVCAVPSSCSRSSSSSRSGESGVGDAMARRKGSLSCAAQLVTRLLGRGHRRKNLVLSFNSGGAAQETKKMWSLLY